MRNLVDRLRPSPRLTVLLYHRIADDPSDPLAVKPRVFERQIQYLSANYHLVVARDLISRNAERKRLPRHTVWVTFDDATADVKEVAAPILSVHGVPATVFVPTASLGRTANWAMSPSPSGQMQVLDSESLKQLSHGGIELGYHSHTHRDFSQLPTAELREELRNSRDVVRSADLPFIGAFAYPFGRVPRDRRQRLELIELFREFEIHIGLRVGSRCNRFPFDDPYWIYRCQVSNDHVDDRLRELVTKPRRARRRAAQ